MRKLWVYFVLQLKRGLRQIPKVAGFALIILLAAAVLCSVLLQQNEKSEKNTMLKVGVTGDLDNTYVKLGILAVKEFDSSNLYVEFVSMTEEDAQKGLKNGELSGYLYIPDDFVDAAMHGKKMELTYYSINSPVGLGPLLANEVVKTASDLVGEMLSGVISVQVVAAEESLVEDMGKLVEDINIRYVSYVLDRDELYEITYTGIENGLSFGGYYACGIIFLMILLMGITCAPMMVRDNSSLIRLANTRGIKIIPQVCCEFAGFALSPLLIMTAIMFSMSIICSTTQLPIVELENVMMSTAFQMIPVILMLCAMQMLLYECCSGIIAGVILQFITAIGLAYICGCFYPPYFFPKSIQFAASVLPGGVAMDYIGGVLNGNGGGSLKVWSYCLVLIALTCVVRVARVRGESK